jgi:hypothetical protein
MKTKTKKTKKKDKWAGKTIKVDWKHIAKGEPEETESCPIALALREQGARDVDVNEDSINIGEKSYDMPGKARTFVTIFDSYRTDVKPMEFKIGKLLDEDWDNNAWL